MSPIRPPTNPPYPTRRHDPGRLGPYEIRPRYPAPAVVEAAAPLLVDAQTEEGVVGRSYLFCYIASGGRAVAAHIAEAAQVVRIFLTTHNYVRHAIEAIHLVGR